MNASKKRFTVLIALLAISGCTPKPIQYAKDSAACWYKQDNMAWTQYPCGQQPQ